MGYREVLYSTYVSANKRYRYQRVSPRARERNLRGTLWSLHGWLPAKERSPRILDLGCGAGHLLAVFQRAGYTDLVGVDNSAEQVDLARQLFPNTIQADVFEYLRRDDIGQFDLITAFDVLEHFTRDETILFLRLVHQRLKPGGYLILQMPNGDSPFAGSVFWSDLTHETLFTAISLRHILEACGFADCEFRECGPVPQSLFGVIRTILWQMVRVGIKLLNYVETGNASTGIYTRVFRCRAIKK